MSYYKFLIKKVRNNKVFFIPSRQTTPLSSIFGLDRGTPIDRYYIEKFLEQNKQFIKGRVLEIAENIYTKQFGKNKVIKSDVLHISDRCSNATIVADLTKANSILSNQFDCIIFTQTLQFIYEKQKAIKELYRILKPGGIVLATASGISKVSRYDMDRWGEYWRFTNLSMQKLFEEAFPAPNITVRTYGNVLAAVGALHGLAAHEIKQKKLDYCDPDYQVLITVEATKS